MKEKQYIEPETQQVCCDKGSCTCGANFEDCSEEAKVKEMYYYYVIAGETRTGHVSRWNYVSKIHPVDKLKQIEQIERETIPNSYLSFWIVSMSEITEESYNRNKDYFEN